MAAHKEAKKEAKPVDWDALCEHVAGPAVLVTAFIVFIGYHDYPRLRVEVLSTLAILITVGVVVSAVMRRGGPVTRTLFAAGLATFYLDLQVDWGNHVLVMTSGLLVYVFWRLRTHVAVLLTSMSVAILAVTLVVPGSTRLGEPTPFLADATEPGVLLPPVLHLILDEHVGVGGIPAETAAGRALRRDLRRFYQDHGFRVFERAFSQYWDTVDSISNLLNFSSTTQPRIYFRTEGTSNNNQRANAYFRMLTERGYQLRVYQSDYMGFCDAEDANVVSCLRYEGTGVRNLDDVSLRPGQKTSFLLRSLLGRSGVLRYARDRYHEMRSLVPGGLAVLPVWPPDPRIGPIPVVPVIERLRADIERHPRGTVFFAHLLTPHFPYVQDANCRIKQDLAEWLETETPGLTGSSRNTPESRTERYSHYFDQIRCVTHQIEGLVNALDAAGTLEEATIIVHGDHGSRLSLTRMWARDQEYFVPSDYADAFSAFFAVKTPTVETGVDACVCPLQDLLGDVMGLDGVVDEPGQVYLHTEFGEPMQSVRMVDWPMP